MIQPENAAGPRISFGCNIDETLQESNSCLYQVAYGNIGFDIFCFAQFEEPMDNVK